MVFLIFINMRKIIYEWLVIIIFVVLYIFFVINTDFSPIIQILIGTLIYSILKIIFGNEE